MNEFKLLTINNLQFDDYTATIGTILASFLGAQPLAGRANGINAVGAKQIVLQYCAPLIEAKIMKLTKSTVTLIGCCGLIALLTGCGTIMCGPQQKVVLDSRPTGAEVLVYDSHGEIVFQKTTPCVARLNRREHDVMQSANYVVLIKKEGYAPAQFPLIGVINRAYFANILSAGIGFAVDPMTGGMWTLTPQSMDENLVVEHPAFFADEGLLVSLSEEGEMKPDAKAAKN